MELRGLAGQSVIWGNSGRRGWRSGLGPPLSECQVTESLFCALRRMQGEHRIYFPNRNNFGMKGGTVHICARLIVITWCHPGQTGTFGDSSNWEALQGEALPGRRLQWLHSREQAFRVEGVRGRAEGWAGLGLPVAITTKHHKLGCCLIAQSCPPLFATPWTVARQVPVHGILQARILEWVAIFFSRGSSQPRDWIWVSCLAGRFFTTEPLGKLYKLGALTPQK